ncbi:hypothetical protein EV401DRAFT_1940253 [Pisolithus croceorrhizus]|nr:hypothetical protein EV401DRAFT_1940253 [Pisolithus croceorrhizus]
MDDACSKRQWVSSRCTTRPEDTAYSLFAIFDLHLSVLYGESAEKALGHLLAEIISQSGAISVLDWVGEASPFHPCFPAHITPFQTLLLPPSQPHAEEPSLTIIGSLRRPQHCESRIAHSLNRPSHHLSTITLVRHLSTIVSPRFSCKRKIH